MCGRGGATDFLLKSPQPLPLFETPILFGSALRLSYVCPVFDHRFSVVLFSLYAILVTRKKITGDELDARANEHGYQRVAHRKITVMETVIRIWIKSSAIKMEC